MGLVKAIDLRTNTEVFRTDTRCAQDRRVLFEFLVDWWTSHPPPAPTLAKSQSQQTAHTILARRAVQPKGRRVVDEDWSLQNFLSVPGIRELMDPTIQRRREVKSFMDGVWACLTSGDAYTAMRSLIHNPKLEFLGGRAIPDPKPMHIFIDVSVYGILWSNWMLT